MRKITYDAHEGQPVRDGEAEKFALDLAEKNLNFVTATENLISATRALIHEGRIPHDSVQFCFGDLSWHADKNGRWTPWPRGFCDYNDDWLGRLFKPKT